MIKPSLSERRDQCVYILRMEPNGLLKIGRGIRPNLRRWQIEKSWGIECRVVWTTKAHPRADQIERSSHRMLGHFRIGARELFSCTLATAKAVISAAERVQDEWMKANPEWLAAHTAKRTKAVEEFNDWHRANVRQQHDAAHEAYP